MDLAGRKGAPRPGPGGRRGAIYGLSKESAKRLRAKLIRLDFVRSPSAFITLTVPPDYPEDAAICYRALKALYRALNERFGDWITGLVWRKEYQKRGAPHYHCVLFLSQPIAQHLLRAFVRKEWTRLTREYLTTANWTRTRVDRIRIDQEKGPRALYRYLASYIAKPEQAKRIDRATGEILPTGRMWGVLGELPLVSGWGLTLSIKDQEELCRRLRRWGRGNRFLKAFTVDRGWSLIFCSERAGLQLTRGIGAPTFDTS